MRPLLSIATVSLLLVGCTAAEAGQPRLKQLTNEWEGPSCTGLTKPEDDRSLGGISMPDAGLGMQICALQTLPMDADYTGPVAIRIIDWASGNILHEERWDSLSAGGKNIGNAGLPEKPSFSYTDGQHTFFWEGEKPDASYVPPQVMDYPNCTRMAMAMNESDSRTLLFEQCYDTPEGEPMPTEPSPGWLRLSVLPEGKELRREYLEHLDIDMVEFLPDQGTLLFTSNGQIQQLTIPQELLAPAGTR